MTAEPRVYTLPEAQDVLTVVRPVLKEAQLQVHAIKECDENLRDLMLVHGQERQPPQPDEAVYEEFEEWVEKRKAHLEILHEAMAELHGHGIEVKDPEMGLIDFYAKMGDELVYLCYKLGEKRIGHWHTLKGGFGKRRPIPGVGLVEP